MSDASWTASAAMLLGRTMLLLLLRLMRLCSVL
jgi:hypothetical protein